MKLINKLISVLTVTALVFSFTACGSSTETAKTETAAAEVTETKAAADEIKGTVTAVSDSSITIETEDGSTREIPVNDSTVYSFTMGDAPDGDMMQGEGQQPPQGDGQGEGQQPPQGDEGNPPEKPDGDMNQQGDGGNPPEKPEGDMNQQGDGGNPPEKPEGDMNQQRDGGNPPEKPEGDMNQQGDGGNPPEKPEGDMNQQGDGGNPPEKPEGDMNQQGDGSTPPEKPQEEDGNPMGEGASLSDVTVGCTVSATLGDDGTATEIEITMQGGFDPMNGGGGPGGGGPGGMSEGGEISYTAANTYESDIVVSGQAIRSTGTDENAILVTGGTVAVDSCDIFRESSDSTGGDNASFYGVGAALLTTGGTLSVSNSSITSDAKGGAGVFAYGDGTAYVSDTSISTAQDAAGGIHVAGGGTLYAWDLNVTTQGNSSAAIRSDRGSGTMVVDGGTYTSNGTGSPAVYSTADITVNNAALTANASEAICIEGKNSIRLYDCELSGNMGDDGQNDCTWDVILYQSMSGDSEEGNSLFEMVGGKLTSNNGGLFYTTNTQSTFILKNVEIAYSDDNDFLLRCTGNSNSRGWGKSGSNGADCSFTALEQTLAGNVVWDSISKLDFYLADCSTLTGAFLQDESCAGNGGNGYANLVIAEGCKWVVTADSVLTSLNCAGAITDGTGNTVSIVGADGTVYVQGTSSVTITVESYTDSADLSGASTADSFSDYSVEELSI